jgi:hypothetical protein
MVQHFKVRHPRPYFAEVPYYLWGEVNYDSEGNCQCPTDRDWTWLLLTNRETEESLEITIDGETCIVEGEPLTATRARLLLEERPGSLSIQPSELGDWSELAANDRALRVASEFAREELAPFDNHYFWGSWKWIGPFATEFTWVGRWIMHSVLTDDQRAVSLCISWLKSGTICHEQSIALRYALSRLTGESFGEDVGWVKWYEGGLFSKGAKAKYPEPDFEAWHAELRGRHDIGAA